MPIIIKANKLEKKFGEHSALDKVDFEVEKGEVVVVIGPSGGGKSTLLRCLINLEKIDAGEIYIDDKFRMGMVFQNFPLFPHLTILENLILAPMLLKKLSKAQAINIARELLEQIDLVGRCGSYPCELSGGQKQRVAIARALAMQPEIILFDEPTSALDPELVTSIINVIKVLAIEKNKTVVITTHQLNFAAEIADRLIFMDQGKIIESGKPEQLLNNPQSERLKLFLAAY
jgi:ABC-type polar amino acid transport system ATPase subunit